MSKRRNTTSSFWLKLLSVLLMVLALTGLMGAFGFAIGAPVYSMFKYLMKGLSWIGPFICFVSALVVWHNSSIFDSISSRNSDRPAKKNHSIQPKNHRRKHYEEKVADQSQNSKVIPLPPGKLVSLQGFNKYFSSPDWVEMKNTDIEMAEEMKEIGRDFPSYFGTGKAVLPKKHGNLTLLKGFNHYFAEVDQEERLTQPISREKISEPVKVFKKRPDELTPFSSVFKSKKEQEEFLAQFKEDVSPVEQEPDSMAESNSENKPPDDVSKISVIETSMTGAEIEAQNISIHTSKEAVTETELSPKPEPELKPELEPTPELVPEAEYEANPELGLETACEVLSGRNVEDNLSGSDPMDVLAETACKAKMISEAQVAAASGLNLEFVEPAPEETDHSAERVNSWGLPDFDLLEPIPPRTIIQDTETTRQLEKVLLDFGVKAKIIRVTRGPVITRYELAPAPGVKISKIVNLSDDIALGLAARDVRIEAPIPGKAAIGIEVPNKQALSVPFREVLETSSFGQYPSKLKVALGKDIADQPIIADLIKMPHLLVAGATGSGKSVCITTIINSLLFNATPDEVKFLLVDPKMVELSQYNGIPHLLAPVVIDPKKAASALKWIVKEMENRYELFAASGVRDIERYNKLKAGETPGDRPALPFVVVIIDELADLMMVAAGEVEEAICRLAQMARAAGIHLVIATQRPSVDVITGVIKANIPSRISFAVSSQIDSRTILDATGAEKLLGRGDMLYSPLGVNKALRVQGCLVTDEEVQRVIMHWKESGKPEYLDPERLFAETTLKNEESNGPDDALFIDAGQLFIRTGIASVSFLQRRLKLGYTRAARLMDMLEEQGVVGGYEGSKPRQVLLTLEEFNERFS
ncbi:DNA translocase FtsK [Desulfosporosinus youngiae]|uniref:DNA segregation ATPase, FtsK/SpoIIIE family n=1 Tax=Desulfosporosinus youngiae DSM 17734 TaxID=768710 RepID=H5XVJ2_9FIRM|nr:DNA translocase FtsK [Desulfosporosinus youngiae]EHQ90075.1 DNA segregation ATPase, FtsK/SpoIIIE family [Desulfosporosinus youngiae DSM 17734]